MSYTVKVETDVTIYNVTDQNGECLPYDVTVDNDGDLNIEIDTGIDVFTVRDFIADNELFDELAEECCTKGIEQMVHAFLKVQPLTVLAAVKDHFGDVVSVDFNKQIK